MADVNANIGVNIDTSAALGQLKDLQRQISQFHTSIAKSSEAASLAQRDLQRNFLNSINSIGAFSAELRTIKTTSESFTASLEKNKFSMREYFRYAGASTKTFGQLFKSEFDTIGKVAEDRVKTLQTQYIKMGRDASGAMKAIAVRPDQLDLTNYSTQAQIAAQKQAIFNQLMKQGSTNLLNFGKNTQWAGRQLMVGFTLPLLAVGSAASKTFMQMEAQAIKFKKVYGDIFTPQSETKKALADIQELGKSFTQYGIAVSDTVGLAADAAAAGFKGVDLQRQTAAATRLSVLGQIDNQKALQTTISLQNAFNISSKDLATNIDFLNAVENQTVLSLDDITTAIPKVAPVIQQLGGNVKDLAFFLTAMKEGGVQASEGANALKSGLASLINPTTRAREMLKGFGIDVVGIVQKDKGDLKKTVIDFAQALDTLAPLQRAQAIEQMFGKFQFARLSTLFQNVTRDGTQASKVLQLAGTSIQDLASLSNKELAITANSPMNKFKKAVEDLKFAIVPVGEAFLKTVTPIINFVTKIADKFSHLSDGTKKAITVMITVIGALGPVLLMTFGLLANGVANIIKLFLTLRTGYQKLTGQSKNLGEQTQYMTTEQLDAAAAAHSLNQAHATLTQQFTAEAEAVQKLIVAYEGAVAAGAAFAMRNPGMMMPPRQKLANSGIVRGPGGPKDDSVPIMASNGEAIIAAETVNANKPLIDKLIRGGKFESKIDLTGPLTSPRGTINDWTKPRPELTAEQIQARNDRALAQIELNRQRRMAMLQQEVAAPVVSRGKQVNVPGTYHSGHFGGAQQMSGEDLVAYAKTISQSAGRAIEAMVAKVEGGLKHLFTVFDNRVVAISDELNLAVGQSGSGKTAPIALARRDLITRGNVAHPELVDQLKKAGMPIEEIKTTIAKLTKEIETGFNNLGDVATVTADDIDAITKKAYETVAKEDQRVNAAYNEMKQITATADITARAGKQNRIPIGKSYKEKRTAYGQNMQEISGGNVPYSLAGAFQINDAMAQEVGKSKEFIANAYKQLSDEVKIKLSLLKDDVQLFSKSLIEEATKAGIAGFEVGDKAIKGIAKGTQSASDSKRAIKEGNNVTSGFVHALENGQDNAMVAGEELGNAGVTGLQKETQKTRRYASRPAGAPMSEVQQTIVAARVAAQSEAKIVKFNSALQGGSFGLMSLAGVAQMFGGSLGKVSSVVFNLSGALFALMTVTQLLTQAKALELVSSRLAAAKQAAAFASYGKGLAGSSGFIGMVARAAVGLRAFLGPIGIATAVVGGLILMNKLLSDAEERRRKKLEAFSDALVTTTEQLKTLGDYFGVNVTKSGLQEKKGFAPETSAQRSEVQKFKESKAYQTYAAPTVSAIKNLNATEATQVLNAKMFELLGAGFSKDQIKTIILAIQQEAGKTDLKIDFNSISFDKLPEQIIKDFEKGSKTLKKGAWAEAVFGLGKDKEAALIPFKKEAALVNKYLDGVSSGFLSGQINGKQFNKMFDDLVVSLQKMPDQQNALLVIDTAIDKMLPKVAQAAKGVGDLKDKMLLLQAAALGLGDQITKNMVSALAYAGTDPLLLDVKGREEDKLKALVANATKVQDQINKAMLGTQTGGTGPKSNLQLAIDQLKKQQTELKNTANAYVLLKKAGLDSSTAMSYAKDQVVALGLATKGITTKQVQQLADLMKNIEKSASAQAIIDFFNGVNKENKMKESLSGIAGTLSNMGASLDDINNILSNPDLTAYLTDPLITAEQSTARIQKYLDGIKAGKALDLTIKIATPEGVASVFSDLASQASTYFDILQKSIQDKFADPIKAVENAATKAADAVKSIQTEIEGLSNQSALIQRQMDITINRPLDVLQQRSAILTENMALIDHAAESVNAKYDAQAAALTKISDINQEIANQQKQQLDLAGAITSGDIAAAAKAAEDMRAAQAAQAANTANSVLEAARQKELAGLTANGMTADQIKAEQYQIERQSFALEQQRIPLTQSIQVIEDKIYEIQNGKLATAQKAQDDAEAALTAKKNEMQIELDAIDVQRTRWDKAQLAIDNAKIAAGEFDDVVNATNDKVAKLADMWNSINTSKNINMGYGAVNDLVTATIADTQAVQDLQAAADAAAQAASQPIPMISYNPSTGLSYNPNYKSMGGLIPKYFAVGGYARGTDTVPAMLTPGEFVVKKFAVDKFGVDNLKSINDGTFKPQSVKTSVNNNSNSVYNYGISVNVSNSNASTDDIARAVMTQIRNIDSQRIRGQR